MSPLAQDALKSVLNYEPATGAWTWRVRRGGTANAGSPAGWLEKSTGYIRIAVLGVKEYGHRLAFLYVEGEFPPNDVDHIDRDGSNCRWANLRHATTSQNLAYRVVKKSSRSGVRGIRKRGSVWEVRVNKDGTQVHRSLHQNKEDAAAAYASAAKTHHGDFARLT